MRMRLVIGKDYSDMSRLAAEYVKKEIIAKSNMVLGLATGSTPVGMYRELIDMTEKGEVSFKDITTVNLDEYYPIESSNSQSYRYFMNDNLFDHIDIDRTRTHVLDGKAYDAEEECAKYEDLITSLGGIDLQVLGIGRNGHIGFNEPGRELYPYTHKTSLEESTIEANSRFFSSLDEVPRYALTMGMRTILNARKIIILASGKEKRDAVERMLDETVDTMCPASLLCLHNDVVVFVTEDVLR